MAVVGMVGLATALEAGPHLDDDLADLESRFVHLRGNYEGLCAKYRPQPSSTAVMCGTLPRLYAPCHPELLHAPSELRDERAELIAALTALPQVPPRQRLLAERVRVEVNAAGARGNGLESMRHRLYDFCTKRKALLCGERALLLSRANRFVRGRSAVRRAEQPVVERLRLLQLDLSANERRLRRLEQLPPPPELPKARSSTCEELFYHSAPYTEETMSCIFRGDIVVCLRAEMFEDYNTRFLRHFLNRLQHLPVSHRYGIWRRALQIDGELLTAERDAARSCNLPCTVQVKSRLELVVEEFGREQGIQARLRTDDGYAFQHAVVVEFPKAFERQQRQMCFESYPWPMQMQPEVVEHEEGESNACLAPHSELGPFLKSTPWLPLVILEPRFDLAAAEQRKLLRNEKAEEPVHQEVESSRRVAAERVRPNRIGTSSRSMSASSPGMRAGPPPDPLQEMRAELRALQEDDAQTALKRLREKARQTAEAAAAAHPISQRGSGCDAPPPGGVALPAADRPAEVEPPPEQLILSHSLLRYLRCRELRCRLLGLLNRFRYAQQKVSHGVMAAQLGEYHDEARFVLRSGTPLSFAASSPSNASSHASPNYGGATFGVESRGGASPGSAAAWNDVAPCVGACPPTLPSSTAFHPGALPMSAVEALKVLSGSERLTTQIDGETVVLDGHGLPIIYDITFQDLEEVEREVLALGSYYVRAHQRRYMDLDADDSRTVDMAAVLYDILEAELKFHQVKWDLLEPYLEVYEHVAEASGRQAVAQRIVDVMACRPWFDLEAPYLVGAYAAGIAALQDRAHLLRDVVDHQMRVERRQRSRIATAVPDVSDGIAGRTDPQLHLTDGMVRPDEGLPSLASTGLHVAFVPSTGGSDVDLVEVFSSLGLAWQVDLFVEDASRHLGDLPSPAPSETRRVALERACIEAAAAEWQKDMVRQPEHLSAPGGSCGDALGETMDDPEWWMFLMEDFMQRLPSVFQEEVSAESSQTSQRGEMRKSLTSGSIAGAAAAREAAREAVREAAREEFHSAFSGLVGCPREERPLRLYLNLLEHVTIRRLLGDTSAELQTLKAALLEQGRLVPAHVGFDLEPLTELTDFPLPTPSALPGSSDAPKAPATLSAAEVDADFGRIDLASSQGIIVHCCDDGLALLRAAYQYELANRWLYTMCALYNTVLLDDPIMRQLTAEQVASESSGEPHRDPSLVPLQRAAAEAAFREVTRLSVGLSWPEDPLTKAAAVAAADRTKRAAVEAPRRAELVKVGAMCQFPLQLKLTVRGGVAMAAQERHRELRKRAAELDVTRGDAACPGLEQGRLAARCKVRILVHCGVLIAQIACDLAVRVQAADAARIARGVFALIPAEFSPFRFSTEQDPRALVHENGSIGNIYHVPRAADLLVLRGLSNTPMDVFRSILDRDSRLPNVLRPPDSGAPADDLATAIPTLGVEYSGAAYVSLQLLERLAPLVASFFFWCGSNGDARVLLQHHNVVARAAHEQERSARATAEVSHFYKSGETDFVDDIDASSAFSDAALSAVLDEETRATRETWGAMEMIRVEFMRVSSQLKMIDAHSADEVLDFLTHRLQAATWRSCLVLRSGAEKIAAEGPQEAVAELRRWQKHVDGYSLDGRGEVTFLLPPEIEENDDDDWRPRTQGGHSDGSHAPRTRSRKASIRDDDGGADAFLARRILKRPLPEAAATGLQSIGSPGDLPAEGRLEPSAVSALELHLCPYLHRFVHALLASHTPLARDGGHERAGPSESTEGQQFQSLKSAGVAAASLPSGQGASAQPLPAFSRAPWRLPGLPLVSLTRALCLLPEAVRRVVAETHLDLELKVDAYVASKASSGPNYALDAVRTESELVQTLITVSRLREIVLCARLRSVPPSCPADCERFDAYYVQHIAAAKTERRPLDSDRQRISNIDNVDFDDKDSEAGDGATGLDAHTHHLVQADWNNEAEDAMDTISRLMCEVHKVLLGFHTAAYSKAIREVEYVAQCAASLVASTMHTTIDGAPMTMEASAATSAKGAVGHKKGEDPADSAAAKAEMVAVLNRVRVRGARWHGSDVSLGKVLLVIREQDLHECFEEFGRRLLHWARATLDAQGVRAKAEAAASTRQLEQAELAALRGRWAVAFRSAELRAQVTAALTEQGEKQFLERDRLRRTVAETAAAGLEMEHRLQVDIKAKMAKELDSLETSLKEVDGRFKKYLGDMRGDITGEVASLREYLSENLIRICGWRLGNHDRPLVPEEDRPAGHEGTSTSPRSLPALSGAGGRGAGGSAVARAVLTPDGRREIEELHAEIGHLNAALAKLQNHYGSRFQTARRKFEKQLQSFKTGLTSHADLWEKCAEVREQGRIVESELGLSTGRVAHAKGVVDRLVQQAASEAEQAQQLEAWMYRAIDRFNELSKDERKYDRVDNTDVPKLKHDIHMLDGRILELIRQPRGDVTLGRKFQRQEREQYRAAAQQRVLKLKLRQEKRFAQKADAKADVIRRERECGEIFDDKSLIGFLADDFRHTTEQIHDLEMQNEALRGTVAAKVSQSSARRVAVTTAPVKQLVKNFGAREQSRDLDNLCFSIGGRATPRAPNGTATIVTAQTAHGHQQADCWAAVAQGRKYLAPLSTRDSPDSDSKLAAAGRSLAEAAGSGGAAGGGGSSARRDPTLGVAARELRELMASLALEGEPRDRDAPESAHERSGLMRRSSKGGSANKELDDDAVETEETYVAYQPGASGCGGNAVGSTPFEYSRPSEYFLEELLRGSTTEPP